MIRFLLVVSLTMVIQPNLSAQDPGYDDTPVLPGQTWRVHDRTRPRPAAVEPGPFAALPRPTDAVVLLDTTELSQWTGRDGAARWATEDGCVVVNGTGDIQTRESYGDCQLHLEWRAPAVVVGESQGRGNSGLFLMGRYEIQILDSYENPTYADGQAAALYGQHPPLVNACRPPGAWQTYDIVFRAPRFGDQGQMLSPARITLLHNGILVHDAQELLGATSHRALPAYTAHGERAPFRLQDHGNPVAFRNIWIRPLQLQR